MKEFATAFSGLADSGLHKSADLNQLRLEVLTIEIEPEQMKADQS